MPSSLASCTCSPSQHALCHACPAPLNEAISVVLLLSVCVAVCVAVHTQLPVRCKVESLSFSAHADYEQTSGFLDELQPPHVVLVHGERGEMMKLRAVSVAGAAYLCKIGWCSDWQHEGWVVPHWTYMCAA